MHYVESLENQHDKALAVSCKSGCPMKEELKPLQPVAMQTFEFKSVEASAAVTPPAEEEEEEDDFFFFPDTASVSSSSEDVSMYQDYFTFLDHDDREELYDQLGDVDAALLNAFGERGGDAQYIGRLGASLMRYGNVLLHYQFFSDMGTSILELGKLVSDEAESIATRAGELQLLISGFCSGLQTYMNEVWDKNCDNPKIFNDSIINDAATIMGIITPAEAEYSDDLVFF